MGNEKWVEQAAFETNEFRAGDRARVYRESPEWIEGKGSGRPYKAPEDITIKKVSGSFVTECRPKWFHFNQCRLLKKIEPQEGWIPRCELLSRPCPGEKGWIKVREVLDDE